VYSEKVEMQKNNCVIVFLIKIVLCFLLFINILRSPENNSLKLLLSF